VEASGVCASELGRWEDGGKRGFPQRIGHEPSGVVEQVGSQVQSVQVGQHVAALTPGTAGAFAEYVVVPEHRVVSMPPDMEFREALAEPIGCLISGLERTEIHIADRVAIVGCGFMGLALLQLVKWRGARQIIAVDVREDALDNALKFGADAVFHPNDVPESDKVVERSRIGQGVDVVFETAGKQPALTLAGEMTRVHGILSIVGWHEDGLRSVDVGLWNWKAIDVINAHERRKDYLVRYMQAGLHMVAAGKLDMASLVTHTYPLAHVDAAFSDLQQKPPGFIKAVVLPQA
jgi:threonine dehydrogenase-like Zn-dependent dehydrogenase